MSPTSQVTRQVSLPLWTQLPLLAEPWVELEAHAAPFRSDTPLSMSHSGFQWFVTEAHRETKERTTAAQGSEFTGAGSRTCVRSPATFSTAVTQGGTFPLAVGTSPLTRGTGTCIKTMF